MSKLAIVGRHRSSLPHSVAVVLIGLILAVVPFYATRYVFAGLMFEKAMLFYCLTTLLVLVYLRLIYTDRQYLPKFNWVGWSFFALMLGFAVATIVSPQPYTSFWGAFNRMDGLISWIYYFVFFVVVTGVLKKPDDWWQVIRFSMVGVALVVVYGLGQMLRFGVFAMAADPWRIESTLGNPVFLGGYLASALPLSLVWVFSLKSPRWRLWGWVFWGLTCLALIFTLSRGSWIAGLIAVPLTLTLYLCRVHPSWLKKILIFSAIGSAAFLLITVGWILSPKNSWFRQIGEKTIFRSESMLYRQKSWSSGLRSFAERPLVGWGLENFHIAFDRNYQPFDRHANFTESHVDRAHNEYVGVMVSGGLIAIVPYMLMLLYALYRGWLYARSRRDSSDYLLNLGMFGALVGYAVFVFTAFNLITNVLFFVLALAWMNRSEGSYKFRDGWWFKPMLGLLAVATTVFACFTVVLPVWAVRLADIGTIELQGGNYGKAINMFKQSLSRRSFMSNVIRSQMSVLASSGGALNIDDKTFVEFQRYTGDILLDIFKTEPYTSYTSMITGMFYSNLSDKFTSYVKIADSVFSRTVDLSPHKGESWLRWGEMYTKLNDWAQAKPKFERAMKEDPYNRDIMFTTGVWHIWFGDVATGEGLIKKAIAAGHGAGFTDVKHIADAFEHADQHEKSAKLYQQIIADPQNEQETVYAIVELVDVYRRAGRWQEARTTVEELRKYEVVESELSQLISDIDNRVAPRPPEPTTIA